MSILTLQATLGDHNSIPMSVQTMNFQVASTVMDVTNGKVIAQLGLVNSLLMFHCGTNQAVETNRDWGSTMKPI